VRAGIAPASARRPADRIGPAPVPPRKDRPCLVVARPSHPKPRPCSARSTAPRTRRSLPPRGTRRRGRPRARRVARGLRHERTPGAGGGATDVQEAPDRLPPRTAPTPTRSSTGRTGRCTSTTTTDARPTRRSSLPEADRDQGDLRRGHRRQRLYYGKIQGQLQATARTSARTSSSSPTGWPAPGPPGLRAEARQGRDPQREEPLTTCRTSTSTPAASYTLTWQSGLRRAGLEQGARSGPAAHASTTSGGRSSRAGSRCSRVARHDRADHARAGVDISKPFTQDSSTSALEVLRSSSAHGRSAR
jgi:hypothetical protein